MISRPPTFSSSWSIVRNPESVCICTPEDPTVSGVKLYLFILNWQGHPLNRSLTNPKLLANFRPKSMPSSCIACAYVSSISLAIREAQVQATNYAVMHMKQLQEKYSSLICTNKIRKMLFYIFSSAFSADMRCLISLPLNFYFYFSFLIKIDLKVDWSCKITFLSSNGSRIFFFLLDEWVFGPSVRGKESRWQWGQGWLL